MYTCINCTNELNKGKKYCSHKCQLDFENQARIAEWRAGTREGGCKDKLFNWAKRYLIEIRGDKCEQCGWNEVNLVTGRVPIEVSHENGHEDHRPESVRLLCPNCHSLTPTFRNLNKGNGREHRRKASP